MTHPFHPLVGKEFVVLERVRSWVGERAFCDDGAGGVLPLPIAWTDLAPEDPFVALSAGRSPLHADELLRLVALIEGLGRKE